MERDIAAFHCRWPTLTLMGKSIASHQRTCRAFLTSADVHPFAPDGEDDGHHSLRQDAEPILRSHQFID